jgi:hypothetical protein
LDEGEQIALDGRRKRDPVRCRADADGHRVRDLARQRRREVCECRGGPSRKRRVEEAAALLARLEPQLARGGEREGEIVRLAEHVEVADACGAVRVGKKDGVVAPRPLLQQVGEPPCKGGLVGNVAGLYGPLEPVRVGVGTDRIRRRQPRQQRQNRGGRRVAHASAQNRK